MSTEFTPWDVQDHLNTPEDCAAFVHAVVEEAGDDTAFIVKALGEVAKAKGMATLARDAGIEAEDMKLRAANGRPRPPPYWFEAPRASATLISASAARQASAEKSAKPDAFKNSLSCLSLTSRI